MIESQRPRILILEADDPTRQRFKKILEQQGIEVVEETVSTTALSRLEKQALSTPFHLFISNFKLPEMDGDEILKQAKTISPLTRRMLTIPSDHPEMVIRTINQAAIHSCVVTPARDQDLIDQVWNCIEDFNQEMKQERLRRVVSHQNKQMVIAARRLKKKSRHGQDTLNLKKKEKLRLTSLLAHANRIKKDPASIDTRISALEIEITPDALNRDFQKLSEYTRAFFDHIAGAAGITPGFAAIYDIIRPAPP